MSTFTVLEMVGLHCQTGGSDKVWGAVLLDQDGAQFILTTVWGPRGGRMASKTETLSEPAARRQFDAKLKEKVGKGYVPFDLGTDRGQYGVRPALLGLHPVLNGQSAATRPTSASTASSSTPRVIVSHLLHARDEDIDRLMQNPAWGLSEKINGVRCTVEVFADGSMCGYNRRGIRISTPPEAARPLATLGVPMLVDGEFLPNGRYGIFDLLEWSGLNVRKHPYSERIERLVAAVDDLRIDTAPVDLGPVLGSQATDLFVLTTETDPKRKRGLHDAIRDRGGEGVVLRRMDGPDVEGDTRHVVKIKFLAELDAFVIGHKPGRDAGSLRMGVVRPTDNAIIEIANVSGGLSKQEIRQIAAQSQRGELPVLSVAFLLARTPGISLVEPRFSSGIRTDKLAVDCTTRQLVDVLGRDRQGLIDAAEPVRT